MGGSEGLRRLRELIEDGFNIQARQHPDKHRSVWQYRLVTDPHVSPLRRTDSGYEHVPEPTTNLEVTPEAENVYKYTVLPRRIDFGEAVTCPRCHAKTRKHEFKNYLGTMRHKDPVKPKGPCIGCNGWGLVPNIGPIPMTEA